MYKMDDLNETLRIVRLIKIDMEKGFSRTKLYNKYIDFAKNKPKSFFHTLDGNFDEKTFIELKNTYKKSYDEASENKDLEGTIKLGETVAEKFLYPYIGGKPKK